MAQDPETGISLICSWDCKHLKMPGVEERTREEEKLKLNRRKQEVNQVETLKR